MKYPRPTILPRWKLTAYSVAKVHRLTLRQAFGSLHQITHVSRDHGHIETPHFLDRANSQLYSEDCTFYSFAASP